MKFSSRANRSISYILDGNYLLAASCSKYISLCNIHQQILVKKFEITHNKSFNSINIRYDLEQIQINLFSFKEIYESKKNFEIR